jgi:hypothetical protein
VRSNLVSKKRLRKTGVFLETAGDSRGISPQNFYGGAVGDRKRLQNPAISGPFKIVRVIFSKTHTGWLRREDSNLDMVSSNQTFSPFREKRQNLLRQKFISNSKPSNFENRIEWMESRALERNGLPENKWAGSTYRQFRLE